ncbi:DNA alkylation repair protein [Pseudoduganella sp. FT26W]|uniref:DNA alkylation repair protein n=1 Tax=Duganella aquatilis TaxID=2666082 RepID=A0A844CV89_9BURK|nr:DNA alkylation repair protein [Duganella aquatilis]MRW84697.1 DNA alkylation repair protein [Duganella aquatilis]
MTTEFLNGVEAALASVTDAARAPAMRAYMRGQFDFLGVGTPQRRAAAKPQIRALKGADADQLLAHARALWRLPQREYHYVALDLLALHWKELAVSDIPALLELVQDKSWWDSVDALAGIIGDVLRGQHDYMDAALQDKNIWVRRIALLHQLGWRDKTDVQRLFSYSLALAHEKEFFIQKAIGWALRDYARHAPDAVRSFTHKEKERLAPLSFREANKHIGVSADIRTRAQP